jgi:hypothetical protein
VVLDPESLKHDEDIGEWNIVRPVNNDQKLESSRMYILREFKAQE